MLIGVGSEDAGHEGAVFNAADEPATVSPPEYLYLLDARVSLPWFVGDLSGPVVGVPWRGPIRAVDGFILGRIADQE